MVLNFCMWFKNGLKAQKLLAQGIALGKYGRKPFALTGRVGQTWGSSFFILPSAYFAQSNNPVAGFRYPSFQVRR